MTGREYPQRQAIPAPPDPVQRHEPLPECQPKPGIEDPCAPDRIQICTGLPKTRSGKVLRRVLKQIALGESNDLGDISGLADLAVVEALLADVRRRQE